MAISAKLRLGASGALLVVGTGAPGFTAPKGSIYLKSDGTDAVLYENRGGGAVWTIPGGAGGGGTSAPIASSTTSGTVKTNTDNADPVVYRKSEVDAAFAPTAHTHAAGDVVSGVLAIGRIPTGSTGTTVALGNDARFSDARAPTAHAASHATGGTDPITPGSIGAAVAGAAPAAHAASHASGGTDPVTPAAIGASATGHVHVAGDITSGTFAVARLGTGTPAAGKYVDGGTGAWTTLPGAIGAATASVLGTVRINGTPTDPANPVAYVKEQTDALLNLRAFSSHTHAAADITTGLLPTSRGGTAADGSSLATNLFFASSATAPGSAASYRAIDPLDIPALAESKITNLVSDLSGKAATTHTHAAGDIVSGVLSIGLIPTGTSGTTVALGNHLHTGVYEPVRLQTRLTANMSAIGTTATTVLTLALAASTHYRFHAVILYVCTVTTATLAARAAYSGTLGTTASGQSMCKVYGSSGVPTVWAATAKENTLAVNATMPTATGGPGAVGSAAVAMFEVEGTIFTNAAGNLTIAVVSSAASGITPQADSHLEAWVMN